MVQYSITPADRAGVEFALALAAQEGWNPGVHDAESFFLADPQGFFLGCLDGRPIGCVSAVSYAGNFGFIGLYIVVPEFRGGGYGRQLWNTALDYLVGHNIGLDGVVEQQASYRKRGFQPAYRNIRYAGVMQHLVPTMEHAVRPLHEVPFSRIAAYDRNCFPAPREAFLRAWLSMPDAEALALLDGDAVAGYGMIRKAQCGYRVGPLFADNATVARGLLHGLLHDLVPGTQWFIDVPEVNRAAVALIERLDMRVVFETARMYTGASPPIALDSVFGVTTFELG